MSRSLTLDRGGPARWLRETAADPLRARELLFSALVVFLTGYLGLTITSSYATVFTAWVALLVLVLMIENQEKTLYLVLFFSTIYMTLKATLLGWSDLAFLFKEGFLALLCGFWLFHFVLRQERLRATPLNAPIGVLGGWILLECFNPNTFGMVAILDDLRFWLGPIAIYFLTVHLVDDRAKLERAVGVVFTYALIEAIYGIAQQFMPGELLVKLGADANSYFYFYQGTIRSFSTIGTAGFALFASMFPCIAFFYMSQQRDAFRRWVFLALGFAFIAGVILTLVRTGWVSVTLSILLYAVITRRWNILIVAVVIAGIVAVTASGYMQYKVKGLINYEEDASVQRRLEIARLLAERLVFRVFGYGLGTFARSHQELAGAGKIGHGIATENWYLMTSLELGWVGVAILAWIWYKVYHFVWSSYRRLKTHRYRELAIALGCSLFAIEIARLGGPSGYYPPDSWHYWFFVGLLMVLPNADQELHAEEQSQAAARSGTPPLAALRPAAAAS